MHIHTLLSILGVLFAATGFSLVFKDYLASLLGGIIIRWVRQVRPDVRIKILMSPNITIKGDIRSIGAIRTTLHEVGDGEHLPSVRTGRTVKVPNFALVNSPLIIYGDRITDEVLAYESRPFAHLEVLEADMTAAITAEGHNVVNVSIYQKDDRLIIHGIYHVKTQEIGDVRGRILRGFLERRRARATASAQSETHLTPELLGDH